MKGTCAGEKARAQDETTRPAERAACTLPFEKSKQGLVRALLVLAVD